MTSFRSRFLAFPLAILALAGLGCGGDAQGAIEGGTDFSISVSNAQPRVRPGTIATSELQFQWVGCPPQDLTLELQGAPAGVTPEFSANPAAVASQLRFRVAPGAVPGTYPLVLRASRGPLAHSKPLQLTVDGSAPSFSLQVTPATLSLDANHPASGQVRIVRAGGFTGEVNLALELPPGFTGAFAPAAPAQASAASDLRDFTVACGSTAPGAYAIRVVASAPGLGLTADLPATVLGLPAIGGFTATPPQIDFGGSSTLQVAYAGGQGTITGLGPVASGAAPTVAPAATTTYVLTVANALGSTASASATVTVAPVVVSLSPPAVTLLPGQSASFKASITGAVDKGITWSPNVTATGDSALFTAPATPGTHTVTAASAARPASQASATVTVIGPTALLTAERLFVTYGEGTTLMPVFSNGTAVLTPALGTLVSGTPMATGPLLASTTYTLKVTGPTGLVAVSAVTVGVVQRPSAFLTASAAQVNSGQSVTLTPTFANGDPQLDPLGLTTFKSGDAIPSGPLNASTTFTLTVTSLAGETATASVTVLVVDRPVITSFTLTGPDTVTGVFTGSAAGTAQLFDNTNPLAPVLLADVTTGQSFKAVAPVPEAFKLVVTNAVGHTAVAYASNILVTINQGATWTMPGKTANDSPSQAFGATVTGNGAGVTWSLAGGPDPGSVGLNSGLYRPSSTPGTYTLKATSKADPGKSDTLAVTVIPLFVWPSGQVIGLGHKLRLRHAILGAASTAVTWSMDPSTPAGTIYGVVDANGVYLSPARLLPPKNPIIVATSVAHPSISVQVPVIVSDAINAGGKIRTTSGGPPVLVTAYAFTPTPRRYHTLTTLANGEVLLAGGEDPSVAGSMPRTAYYYRTADRTFYAVPSPMVKARSWASATLLHDGSVLIVGGHDETNKALASAERYYPNAAFGGTFAATAGSLSRARWEHTATLLPNGKVLIVGGQKSNAPAAFEASAELYDPATDSFTLLASGLRTPRTTHRAVRLADGKVLVAGGSTDGLPTVPSMSKQADIFDPATSTFTPATDMGWKTMRPLMDLSPTGDVLLAGGTVADTGVFPSAFFQTYSPLTDTWIPAIPGPVPFPSLSANRFQPMGLMLPDTTFCVWGGSGLDSVDFWAPGAGSLDSTINIPTSTVSYAPLYEGSHGRLVLMLDGRILAAGWDGVNLFTFRAVTIP